MKHKITLRNPEELIVGTRVKIPIAGWFLGSKKRQIWYKGTIVRVGRINIDGKIHYVETSLRPRKDYGSLGRVSSINEQCNYIYKVK